MLKIRNKVQLSISCLEESVSHHSLRKIKRLENTWAHVFRNYVLDLLPVYPVSKFYSSYLGRDSKELYAMIGLVVLQQFFDLTDQQAIDELAFNEKWQYALKCYEEKDQLICEKTLWTMRDHIVELGLVNTIFSLITDNFVKQFDVDVSKVRLDSVHVHSNMARLGRIRIMVRTIIKFLKNLKRQNITLFNSEISLEMIEKYLKRSAESFFGQIRPSDSERTLQTLGEELYSLILAFKHEERVSQMITFQLLQRVFSDHCNVENNQVQVKIPKKVPSSSVQNPSDPDAGYDGHKGQGYQNQLLETYSIKSDKENQNGSDENAKNPEEKTETKLNLILHTRTESADNHDSKALELAIKDVQDRGHKVKQVLADTLYGSNENVQKSQESGVEVIAPIPGKSSTNKFECFAIDPDNLEISSCSTGKNPDEIKYNSKGSITATWYETTCENCPFADSCPTHKCKKGRKINYTKKSAISFLRRQYEESLEFKDKYRYRSGIEATISRFIHMTSARRSRYRGLEKLQFGQTLKALAINVFRTAKYIQKVYKNTITFNNQSKFSNINVFALKFVN